MSFKPGQIYWANFGGTGDRPVVIVSREELNRCNYVVVVPVTSARFEERSKMRNCVPFYAGDFGLTKDCVAQTEVITFLEITELDQQIGLIGELGEIAVRNLVKAIGYMISSECEPV